MKNSNRQDLEDLEVLLLEVFAVFVVQDSERQRAGASPHQPATYGSRQAAPGVDCASLLRTETCRAFRGGALWLVSSGSGEWLVEAGSESNFQDRQDGPR